MNSAADADKWRKKYFDSLDSLEQERRELRTFQAALKRLIGRLCNVGLGQSPQLDEQLRKLQSAVRRESTSEELERIASGLTDAIRALDRSGDPTGALPTSISSQPSTAPPAAPEDALASDAHVRAVLSALLTELRRDSDLVAQSDALDAQLAEPMTLDRLPRVLSSLTELVAQRIRRIEHAKHEIESLLGHMVGKLDEIGQFVVAQNRTQSESQASSETLNMQLAGEMQAMGETVESAGDLDLIRAQVRSRLILIDQYLQQFREREASLASEVRVRNEQMQSRITSLEQEANRLQSQLCDEKRLAVIDALTNVPNRLAYEKRIEEELKRWQRFGQPTCLAVWDIDRFKQINDTYGHRAGDRVLRSVAECFAGRIRSTDFLARYGGEEFVMILPGTQLEEATRVVDGLRAAIAQIGFHFRGDPVTVTISCGFISLRASDTAGTAFDRADKALYQAKQGGRNRCVSG